MGFTLYYSDKYNEIIFPIEYMNLPIRIERVTNKEEVFELNNENESFKGIREILNQIILLCKKVDPHDLGLINKDVIHEIDSLFNSNIQKIIKNILKRNEEVIIESGPKVGLNLISCYNNKQPTLTDIYIFTKMFKHLRNGGKIDSESKKWFENFQDEISKNLRIEPIGVIDFHYFDIRVGRIDSVYPVEDRDFLYVENVMADKRREICSGLRTHCEPSDLCGKQFLFLINLKPKKMGKNNKSEGMILCAKYNDIIEPIEVQNKKEFTGKRVTIENQGYQIIPNFEYPILDLSSSKSENAKESLKHFKIIDYVLYFDNRKLLINNEEIRTKKIKNGIVS